MAENKFAIVVRKDAEGFVLLPATSDILPDTYALALLTQLVKEPGMWMRVLSEVLSRPTPTEWVELRPGPSGKMLSYVEGSYAKLTRQALARIGIASDFEVLQTDVTPEEVDCLCRVTFKYGGQTVAATQWGQNQRHSGVSLGNTKKAAATDGEKKCLTEFGWALDVYRTEAVAYEAPSPEEMKAKAVEGLYAIGQRAGMTTGEVDTYVFEVAGVVVAELSSVDLTSVKRKLERKAAEHVDDKTKSIKGVGSE